MITDEMFQELSKRVERLEAAFGCSGTKSADTTVNKRLNANANTFGFSESVPPTTENKELLTKEDFMDFYVGQLHHRFLRAQFVAMITSKEGFNKELRKRGYRYAFEQIATRIREARHLRAAGRNDVADAMLSWFKKELVLNCLRDYREKIANLINSAKVHHNKKENYDYKCILGKNYKVEDVGILLCNIDCYIDNVDNFSSLSSLVVDFLRCCKFKKKWDMPKAFIEAYKGWGAFSAILEFIRFDDCRFFYDEACTVKCDKDCSINILYDLNDLFSCNNEGYKLVGVFKKLMVVNEINLEEKLNSWRKTDI